MSTSVSVQSEDPLSKSQSPATRLCPTCREPYRQGDATCSRCGSALAGVGQTGYLTPVDEPPNHAYQPRGAAFVTPQKPIELYVKTRLLRLPLAEKVVVGRFNGNPDEVQPDVDLAPLGAGEAGVSRRHLQITYRNGGVYAADLGSSNGTWLNGIRVFAHSERLLRSGDELRLGTLKVYITF